MKYVIFDPCYILASEDWQGICQKAREESEKGESWNEAFKLILAERLEELANEEEKPYFKAERIAKLMREEDDGDYSVYVKGEHTHRLCIDSGITSPIPYSVYEAKMHADGCYEGYHEGIDGIPTAYELK